MANPQPEKGHVPIARELIDGFMRYIGLPLRVRIIFWVLRNTYGYLDRGAKAGKFRNRKTVAFTWAKIARDIGTRPRLISNKGNILIKESVLFLDKDGKIGVQKDFDLWGKGHRLSASNGDAPQTVTKSASNGDVLVSNGDVLVSNGDIARTRARHPIHPTPITPNGGGREPASGPGNGQDAYHRFMNRVFTDYMGLEVSGGGEDVAAAYVQFGKVGARILAFAKGDADLAFRGVQEIGSWMRAQGLDWTLNTIANRFLEWKTNPEDFDATKKRNSN